MDIDQPPVSDYVKESKYVAQGDILQRGAGESERLGVGLLKSTLRVNAAGTLLEYIKPQYSRIYVGANQVIASAVESTVQFNTVDFQYDDIFDDANYRIIPTELGIYVVHVCIKWNRSAALGTYELRLFHSVIGYIGASTDEQQVANIVNISQTVSAIVPITGANQALSLKVLQDTGVNQAVLNGVANSFLEVYRIA